MLIYVICTTAGIIVGIVVTYLIMKKRQLRRLLSPPNREPLVSAIKVPEPEISIPGDSENVSSLEHGRIKTLTKRAKILAPYIIHSSTETVESAISLFSKLQGSRFEVDFDILKKFVFEVLIFQLHYIDRLVPRDFDEEEKKAFIITLAVETIELYLKDNIIKSYSVKSSRDFISIYNEKHSAYRKFRNPSKPAKSDRKSTLFWEFSKIVLHTLNVNEQELSIDTMFIFFKKTIENNMKEMNVYKMLDS